MIKPNYVLVLDANKKPLTDRLNQKSIEILLLVDQECSNSPNQLITKLNEHF